MQAFSFGESKARIINPDDKNKTTFKDVAGAKEAKEEGKEKVILVNWSGHGLMDLVGYDKYFNGELENYALPAEDLARFSAALADFPKPKI